MSIISHRVDTKTSKRRETSIGGEQKGKGKGLA